MAVAGALGARGKPDLRLPDLDDASALAWLQVREQLVGHHGPRQRDNAFEAAASLVEDRSSEHDALALYIAGEAYVHGGHPAQGVELLQRALARDPELTPAIYHLFERRLAAGDWQSVDVLARRWERVDPSDSRGLDYRAQVAVGQAQYAVAEKLLESLLDRSHVDSRDLNRPGALLVYVRFLAGQADAALEQALRVSESEGTSPQVASAMTEPAVYAWALAGDRTDIADQWAQRARAKLGSDYQTANHWQLAYTMAILDLLARRTDVRERWLGGRSPDGISRPYRFAAHRAIFEALLADARGDTAEYDRIAADERADIAHFARALRARAAGADEQAAQEMAAALASSPEGEFDCVYLELIAEAAKRAGDEPSVDSACARVRHPWVPRPYCLMLAPACNALQRSVMANGR